MLWANMHGFCKLQKALQMQLKNAALLLLGGLEITDLIICSFQYLHGVHEQISLASHIHWTRQLSGTN